MSGDADIAILERLFGVIEARKGADPANSYTAELLAGGPDLIAAKLVEEAGETADAALSETSERLAAESADLLYHLLVLWAAKGIKPADVWAELARRQGVSGLAEKAARRTRLTTGGN
jgi:phosphoribosyl-ATP pyrophosphohydrolase